MVGRVSKNATKPKGLRLRIDIDLHLDFSRNPQQLITIILKRILLPALMMLWIPMAGQSIYISKSNTVSFFAGTSVEDIDATNTKALSLLNITTGEITISIPNKEFHFKRSLMEEHFNENYMESDKYPKSEFKGKINNIEKYDLLTDGPFQVTVTGTLTVHGVAKERTLDVQVQRKDGKLQGETKFKVALADHKIDRPKILWEKMAENVDITASFIYELYKK